MLQNARDLARNFLKTSLMGGATAVAVSDAACGLSQAPDERRLCRLPILPMGATSKVSLAAGEDRAKIAFDSLMPFKRRDCGGDWE